MRFSITHWDMSAPHEQFTVEVEAVDAAGADALAHEVAGFGHTYLVRPLPEPAPEPEGVPEPMPDPEPVPERLVVFEPDAAFSTDPDAVAAVLRGERLDAAAPPKPKRKRRVKSGVA